MNRDAVLNILRSVRTRAEQDFNAHVEGIFGSVARGDNSDTSDVDVLVKFSEQATFFDLVELGEFLEEVLGCKVDIVSSSTIREELRPQIQHDMIPL